MKVNRRELLKGIASIAGLLAFGAGGTLVDAAGVASNSSSGKKRKRALRIAHMTDMHVTPKREAERWFAECLHHIQNQEHPPAFIINTGDSIMDSLKTDEAMARNLWAMWNKLIKNECSLPVKTVLGNHDIFGWGLDSAKRPYKDLQDGKKFGLDHAGLSKAYYSFEKNGWSLMMLDSVQPTEPGVFKGILDDAQHAWLAAELERTPTDKNVLVFSHMPILAACMIPTSKRDEKNSVLIPQQAMHTDTGKLVELFRKYPAVKGCMSGHIHLLDEIQLYNVRYCCNGAVSGNWWKGELNGIPPGYTMLNLYSDGTFDREYVAYGWKATDKINEPEI